MDKKSGLLYISISFMVVVVIVLGVILTLDREEPNIYVQTEVNQKDIYWNLQTPIRVEVADKSKLKSFEIIPFKATDGFKATNAILRVKAKDSSSWNFFDGNEAIKDTNLIIDRRSPQASVISNSYMIKQGGSGILIVEINDEVIFELFPFHKKNFYISIITWPIDLKEFQGVKVVAIDMAGNKASTKVPFYYDRFKEKVDNLNISDDFIYSVSKNVLELCKSK